MSTRHEAADWQDYKMDYKTPYAELEPLANEADIVGSALNTLVESGIIPNTGYDHEKLAALREQVPKTFDIPWSAISPRVGRLLYAITAIARPVNFLAAGVFCGNTFISCAGAAVGAGACYRANRLVGVEIDPERANMTRRNLAKIDPEGLTEILAEDAIKTATEFEGQIDMLYLDADGGPDKGKGVYLDILEAAYDKLSPGAIVLAHNSVNAAERLRHYLEFVRDPSKMTASVNVVIDPEGLEVSAR